MVRISKSSLPKKSSSEIHDPDEYNETIWQTKMHQIAIDFTSTFIGQVIILQFDKLLWSLEKTASWISTDKTDAKQPAHLIRPLPWVLFLPTLVALRYTRIILSLLSICLGYDEIKVSTMVERLHQSRQTIRHIMHEATQNEQLHAILNQNAPIDYFKRLILSVLSLLRSLVFPTSASPVAVHNSKSSLNSSSAIESTCEQRPPNDNDEAKQLYRDFLSRTITSSDSDDEDFMPKDSIEDENLSDSSSLSSYASDDLLNDEIDMNRRIDGGEISSKTADVLVNNSQCDVNDTSVANDTIDKEKRNAVGPPDNVQVDAALDHLIDSTLAAMGYKSVTHNRGKNINRHHEIDGRSHEKSQNNGSNLTNDGHMESESISASNNQIDTAHEFMVTETATAADHTQAD